MTRQDDTSKSTFNFYKYKNAVVKYVGHFILDSLLVAISILIADSLLDGLYIKDWSSLFWFVIIIGILNIFIWPIISRLAFPFILLTLGFGTLILNGIIVIGASYLVEGVVISRLIDAIFITIIITIVSLIFTLIASIDDDYSYYRYVLKRINRKNRKNKDLNEVELKNKKPGVLFIEIDGLSKYVIDNALRLNKMPTLSRWLKDENYKLAHWVTDMASQTSASQAGILLGNNKNVPAFRWVDRNDGYKVITSSDPDKTPLIEKSLSSGNGLLKHNGASRVNMYSGDAEDTLFTLSKIKELKNVYNKVLVTYFAHPYNFSRTLILFIFEIFLEYKSRIRQRVRNVEPRLGREKRGGIYPFVRAAMTVFMRDLNTYSLINDTYSGEHDVIYSTYAGYDEIAHHSGIEDDDAYKVLTKLDKQFKRLEMAIKEAPRKYHIVLLSDHGQTKGKTFKQRYGITLSDYVKKLLKENFDIEEYLSNDEGISNVRAVLSTILKDDSLIAKKLDKSLDKIEYGNTSDKSITRQDIKDTSDVAQTLDTKLKNDLIVLASGNLGLIYFKKDNKRLTLEEMKKKAPGFVESLSKHEGIGFIVVKNENNEAVLIVDGKEFNINKEKDKCSKVLKDYGNYAVESILRIHSFDNCPDILVNSFYNPETNEGAAFEELIGFHGGLGGTQNIGFVMYPSDVFEFPDEEIFGAESLYHIFQQWLRIIDKT